MTAADERGAGAVRTLMAEVDLPPSRVDLDLAVRTARRLDRRQRVVTTAAVMLAVGAASGAVAVGVGGDPAPKEQAASRECAGPPTVTALTAPQLDHYGLTFTGADPSGRYMVGGAYVNASDRYIIRGVLWVDGAPRLFEVPPRGKDEVTYPTDVNGKGVVVGGDVGDAVHTGPWTYQDGQVRSLPPAPGYDTYNKLLVNERGDVVATARKSTASTTTPSVGVVWPADAPDQPLVLRAPGSVLVTGIAEDGTVLGQVGEDLYARTFKPYAWTPGGEARALAVPNGWEGGSSATVRDGRIVGYLTRELPADPTGLAQIEAAPAQWPLGGGDAEVGPAFVGFAVSATDRGWLSLRGAASRDAVVLVAPDGADRPLSSPAGADITLQDALWVSEDGRTVVGMGKLASLPESSNSRPAVWRC